MEQYSTEEKIADFIANIVWFVFGAFIGMAIAGAFRRFPFKIDGHFSYLEWIAIAIMVITGSVFVKYKDYAWSALKRAFDD